jgi:hypothetical protein
MSEILKLREWLGLADATRYARQLKLDVSVSDLFATYSELGYPMQLDFKNPRLYIFEPSVKSKSYPYTRAWLPVWLYLLVWYALGVYERLPCCLLNWVSWVT